MMIETTTVMQPSPNAAMRISKGTMATSSFTLSIPSSEVPIKSVDIRTSIDTSADDENNKLEKSHFAQLALLCCQNSINMGARTQLNLCPPPRRRELQSSMRNRRHSSAKRSLFVGTLVEENAIGGYFGLDKLRGSDALKNSEDQEEDYLLSANTFDFESDEEQSSGDEDELFDKNWILQDMASKLDHPQKYSSVSEPIFTPTSNDQSHPTNPNQAAQAASHTIPFNYRKIRYFDTIDSLSQHQTRTYLRNQLRKLKRRDGLQLRQNLRKFQREERRRLAISKGKKPPPIEEEKLSMAEEDILYGGVAKFEDPMTPTIAATLLVESLELNPHESIEGMADCYDGIVAAGVALLDLEDPDNEDDDDPPTQEEILDALGPLLISSLHQASGEVVLLLAKLRRMCGTPRYQRRFIQRVAPSLVRPKQGAMWCLRHQNDIEPILKACELILDNATDIFDDGWYMRGKLLANTNANAKRLQDMHHDTEHLSSLALVLSSATHHGHGRRGSMQASKNIPVLDKHEVKAVDKQIRLSISGLFNKDWSKVAAPSRDHHELNRLNTTKRAMRAPQTSPKPTTPRSPTRNAIPKAPLDESIMDAMILSPVVDVTKTPPRSPSPTNAAAAANQLRSISPVAVPPPPVDTTPPGSGSPPTYRMLTSTAAERKRTVAACRALRSQIQRFEEAFLQLHGRPPKGAAERAPLATTYAQYREWKRAIRSDAACRIQALFRGSLIRLMLLRSNDPHATRIVRRAKMPSNLNIPVELLGQENSLSSFDLQPTPKPDAPEIRRSNQRAGADPPTSSSTTKEEAQTMSMPELQARKRDLKQQLKQYDMDFVRKHGRMPVKSEKEPIRHLYEDYNKVKTQITDLEKQPRHLQRRRQPAAKSQPPPTSPKSVSSSSQRQARTQPSSHPNVARKQPTAQAAASKPRKPQAAANQGQDLTQLKIEKQKLHLMLRSYEKDFFKEHKRQVGNFADIKPVASQYRRYKEIKKLIANLEKQQS